MALKLKKVSYVMLSVADVEKTVGFYQNKLGLEVGYSDKNWAELKTEGFVLALHSTEKPASAAESAHAPTIIFASNDLVADRKELLAMDVHAGELHQVAENGDTIGVSCDFSDPNGQPLSLFAYLTRSQWETIKNA